MIYTDDWAEVMHRQIERVLDWPTTNTQVAYDKSDKEFIYGFASGDPRLPSVYYVCVKAPYRRVGYATQLLNAIGVSLERPFVYACRTSVVSKLTDRIPFAKWDPMILRFPPKEL